MVAKTDGTVVDVNVGDDAGDPVFCVTDLLHPLGQPADGQEGQRGRRGRKPRRAYRQLLRREGPSAARRRLPTRRKLAAKEPVKAFALKLLAEKYGIAEEDFLSAEIEVVPAGRARELGFDRSMVIGYGQDDRVCAYTSLEAQLALVETPKKTAVAVLVDKEEIGSVGATGMALAVLREHHRRNHAALAGLESPLGAAPRFGRIAHAFLRRVRRLRPCVCFGIRDEERCIPGYAAWCSTSTRERAAKAAPTTRVPNTWHTYAASWTTPSVSFQTAELGKVDAGGGGTIAYIPAKYGMDVIDSGVAGAFDARSVGSYLQGRYLRGVSRISRLPRGLEQECEASLCGAPSALRQGIQRGWVFIQLKRSKMSRKT